MPEQDESSVWETVEYAERLLKMFKGTNVNPMICPMIPFLDPASTFFERPAVECCERRSSIEPITKHDGCRAVNSSASALERFAG
jgi:hypothetical protein